MENVATTYYDGKKVYDLYYNGKHILHDDLLDGFHTEVCAKTRRIDDCTLAVDFSYGDMDYYYQRINEAHCVCPVCLTNFRLVTNNKGSDTEGYTDICASCIVCECLGCLNVPTQAIFKHEEDANWGLIGNESEVYIDVDPPGYCVNNGGWQCFPLFFPYSSSNCDLDNERSGAVILCKESWTPIGMSIMGNVSFEIGHPTSIDKECPIWKIMRYASYRKHCCGFAYAYDGLGVVDLCADCVCFMNCTKPHCTNYSYVGYTNGRGLSGPSYSCYRVRYVTPDRLTGIGNNQLVSIGVDPSSLTPVTVVYNNQIECYCGFKDQDIGWMCCYPYSATDRFERINSTTKYVGYKCTPASMNNRLIIGCLSYLGWQGNSLNLTTTGGCVTDSANNVLVSNVSGSPTYSWTNVATCCPSKSNYTDVNVCCPISGYIYHTACSTEPYCTICGSGKDLFDKLTTAMHNHVVCGCDKIWSEPPRAYFADVCVKSGCVIKGGMIGAYCFHDDDYTMIATIEIMDSNGNLTIFPTDRCCEWFDDDGPGDFCPQSYLYNNIPEMCVSLLKDICFSDLYYEGISTSTSSS